MKIEPGAYRLRNGRKWIVLCNDAPGLYTVIGYDAETGQTIAHTIEGIAYLGMESDTDIIAPWIDEPEVGEGWEFCAKEEAEGACVLHQSWSSWEDLSHWRYNYKPDRYRFRKRKKPVCSVCGLGHSTEDCDLVGDEPQDCIACGARNPSHYLKDGICPLCRDREKLSLAIERAEKAEAEVERLRNCIRGLWNNPTYHGNGITEDIKQIFTLYDLTQDEVDKE